MHEAEEVVGRAETATRLRFLEPGLALRISDLTDSLDGYACRLVENDGTNFWVDLPIRRDGMLSLAKGQLITVRFERAGDARYQFDSVVAEARENDRAPFGIALPVTITRRPRRNDARMSLVLDATFEVPGDNGAQAAKVVDVSAGGVALICDRELHESDQIVIHTAVPLREGVVEIDQPAEVRSAAMYGRTPGGVTLHQYGLRYVEAEDDLRNRIVDAIIWNLTSSMG